MITFTCYDCVVAIEGPPAVTPYIEAAGFELGNEKPTEKPLLAFRIEQNGNNYNLYQEDTLSCQNQTLALISEVIISRVHGAVCFTRSEVTFLRGDVVKESNLACVFAGDSFTGQTRLAQAYRSGSASTYSQHFAVLNDAGEFLPYPAASLPSDGLKASKMFLLQYHPQSTPDLPPASVSSGVGSLHLLTLVRGHEEAIQSAMPRLARAIQGTEIYKGIRGEAKAALRSISRI